MSDVHPCSGCVWTNMCLERCYNPLHDIWNIEERQSRCKYYIDKDDLTEMYEELGIYHE